MIPSPASSARRHALLPPRWNTPELFARRLGEKAGRQRIMVAEGHLLLILHKAPKVGESEHTPRLFWRNPTGEWQSSEGGAGLADLIEHVAEYDRAVDVLEKDADIANDANDFFDLLRATTPLLRAAHHLHATLQQAREAVPADPQLISLRDTAADIERTLELLHSDSAHAMQFLVAARAEEQARNSTQIVASSQRLNLLMALFLPLTAVASLLGMNLPSGFENRGPGIFWLVTVGGFILGLIILSMVAAPVVRKNDFGQPLNTKKRQRRN